MCLPHVATSGDSGAPNPVERASEKAGGACEETVAHSCKDHADCLHSLRPIASISDLVKCVE